jgi:hypothetical protein
VNGFPLSAESISEIFHCDSVPRKISLNICSLLSCADEEYGVFLLSPENNPKSYAYSNYELVPGSVSKVSLCV